jgi:CHASE2 domain-containing sensor protein
VAFIGVVFAALAWSGALDSLEDLTVDYRLRLRKPQPVSDDVRLVGIGDRDVELAALGAGRFHARHAWGCAEHSERHGREAHDL